MGEGEGGREKRKIFMEKQGRFAVKGSVKGKPQS